MSSMQEGGALWEGVPEPGIEQGAPILVQRERPGGGRGPSPPPPSRLELSLERRGVRRRGGCGDWYAIQEGGTGDGSEFASGSSRMALRRPGKHKSWPVRTEVAEVCVTMPSGAATDGVCRRCPTTPRMASRRADYSPDECRDPENGEQSPSAVPRSYRLRVPAPMARHARC